jgi:hypothetical protein
MSEDIQNTSAEEQAEGMLSRAISLAQQGKALEARRLLQMILEGDRDNALAWMWLASTYSSDSDRLRLLQYYLDRHPESDLVSKAVLSIRERISRRESRVTLQEAAAAPAAVPEPSPAPAVQEEALPAPHEQPEDGFNQDTSLEDGMLDHGPLVLQEEAKEEETSESRLLLIAIAVIAVTVISALLWTILT